MKARQLVPNPEIEEAIFLNISTSSPREIYWKCINQSRSNRATSRNKRIFNSLRRKYSSCIRFPFGSSLTRYSIIHFISNISNFHRIESMSRSEFVIESINLRISFIDSMSFTIVSHPVHIRSSTRTMNLKSIINIDIINIIRYYD